MEKWREQQPIMRTSQDCDCCIESYLGGKGYCGEPVRAFQSCRQPPLIHNNMGLNNTKRHAAFMQHSYDKNKVLVKEGYVASKDSFDPSKLSLFNTD